MISEALRDGSLDTMMGGGGGGGGAGVVGQNSKKQNFPREIINKKIYIPTGV